MMERSVVLDHSSEADNSRSSRHFSMHSNTLSMHFVSCRVSSFWLLPEIL